MLTRRCLPRFAVLFFSVVLIACEREAAKTAMSTTPRGRIPKLYPDACSTIPVSTGAATFEWIVKPTSEDIESVENLSTTDLDRSTDGTLWLIDRYAARVTHLDSSGQKLHEWGQAGQGPGEFKRASAITVAPDNTIVVGDEDGRITIFSGDGTVLRTLRPRIDSGGRISDLVALPNNQFVVALNVMMEGVEGASRTYVAIVDSVGNIVKRVLEGRITRDFQRPLVGHLSNNVRLTRINGDRLGVWYPMDNFVDVIDLEGQRIKSIVGCFPPRNEASYVAQRKADLDSQGAQTLTAGVEIINDSTIRIVSIHRANNRKMLRVRLYTFNQGEVSARDYDVEGTPFINRVEVIGTSNVIAFSDQLRESGLARIGLR